MSRLEELIQQLCPDGVEYKELGEIATISRGGNFQKKDFVDDGFPCIHYGQIYTKYNLFVDCTISYISPETAEKQKKAVCGDIIMAVTSENIEDVCKSIAWLTDSNLNHTGIYLYSKGKIMIHLTFDYKTDEKCTTPGQYLKYHRTFQGLTTRELAEKVGIVPATLVLYENDRHPIKHDIAVALANTLGIDRNRLLDEYTAFVDYPYSSLLKKVRHELSLTQMQMAEVIGIGQTTYSGWEREARVPRRKEHDKILAALKKLKVNVDTYLCQSTSI